MELFRPRRGQGGGSVQPPAPKPSPPDETAASDGQSSSDGMGSSTRAPRRTRATTALTLALILLLFAAGVYLLANGSRTGNPPRTATAVVKIALVPEQTLRYRFHMTVASVAASGGSSVTSNEVFQATSSWHVDSVDAQGQAAVTVTMTNVNDSVDGTAYAQPTQTLHLQIAADDRVLAEAGFGTTSGPRNAGPGFPGMDQLIPLLPGHPVAVGEVWNHTFDQANPLGTGTIHFATASVLMRPEQLKNVRAAVIHSTSIVSIDALIDLRSALAATGQPTTGLVEGTEPINSYI